jgi:hypothetical protein
MGNNCSNNWDTQKIFRYHQTVTKAGKPEHPQTSLAWILDTGNYWECNYWDIHKIKWHRLTAKTGYDRGQRLG